LHFLLSARAGKIEREGVVHSDREAVATFIKSYAPHVARIGLETGATATWLWTKLNKLGLPVICIAARHAKAVLKMQINKSEKKKGGTRSGGSLQEKWVRRGPVKANVGCRWHIAAGDRSGRGAGRQPRRVLYWNNSTAGLLGQPRR
jgi:hypothetical protein